MRKSYFPINRDHPAALQKIITRQVRFEEVDSMGIVWHGRYPSYFEDGRVALGHNYGVSYADFIRQHIPVPIRQMGLDYLAPLYFEDTIEIETLLHWSDAARINFEYIIRKEGKVVCTGYTVQLMLDDNLDLLLEPPVFYRDFLDRWRKGELQ